MLTAKEIEARKQKRRNLVAQKELIELQAERIKAIVAAWDKHPEPKPVGKDFYTFVYNLLKNNDYVVDTSIAKIWAEKAAENIGWRTNQDNPLNMDSKVLGKSAATIYTPEKGSGGIYGQPEEITRYCPDHPGSMLQRISDGVYQCRIDGDVFSYTGGHKVEFKGTPSEQFTDAVDNYRQSKVPVLFHEEVVGKADTSNLETEESYDTEHTHQLLGIRANIETKKEAGYYGPTEASTRFCPDHTDVQLARVADGLYQCEVDGQVYRRTNSIAAQTPDDPNFYGSRPGLKSADSHNKKTIKADARGDETRFAFDLMQALNGNIEKRQIIEQIIGPLVQGDSRSLSMLISDVYNDINIKSQLGNAEEVE